MSRKFSKPVYGREFPWWVYDLLIVAGCAFFVVAALLWTKFALVPLAVLCYGSYVEPRLLKIRRYALGTGGRTLKIAFISDVHVGPYKGSRWVEKLARRTNALAPDVTLLGGDFLFDEAKYAPLLEPFKDLRAPLGVYAILGNHDEWKASKEAHAWFAASGIPLLENHSVRVQKDGADIVIAGADDDWYGDTRLEAAFEGIRPEDVAVVMLHNPDLVPPAAKMLKGRPSPTVFVSGHTHGGQIRLPFIGPVPPLPHHLGRKYDRGIFEFEGMPLVIGAGAGESGPRARLFCPPEIVLVTMRY